MRKRRKRRQRRDKVNEKRKKRRGIDETITKVKINPRKPKYHIMLPLLKKKKKHGKF